MVDHSAAGSAKRVFLGVLIAAIVTFGASSALALVVITTDPAQAAAFQAGATIENFDNLPALAITSYASGQTVPSGNQFKSRNVVSFTALAVTLPLIAVVYERWGFDTLFLILAASAAVIFAAVACLPRRLPAPPVAVPAE